LLDISRPNIFALYVFEVKRSRVKINVVGMHAAVVVRCTWMSSQCRRTPSIFFWITCPRMACSTRDHPRWECVFTLSVIIVIIVALLRLFVCAFVRLRDKMKATDCVECLDCRYGPPT